MRRILAPLVLALMFSAGLAGCLSDSTPESTDDEDPLRVRSAQGAAAAVPEGDYRFDGQWSQVVADGPYKELGFEKVFLESEIDGADIEVGVWRPDVPDGTKVPVIADAGPYYGNLEGRMETRSRYILMMTTNFLPHGYAIAAIAVRGTGGSGGCMDLMGPKERADLSQAVTWLGTQEWSNGNVGMIGRSYDGSTPWSVAATGNPHLKTVVPVSGVPDVYELMFRNGTAESRGPFLLNALYYAFFARTDPRVDEREVQHVAEGVVCPESWHGLAASAYAGATGSRDPTGWWAERNNKVLTEANWNGSVLMVQGLQDWNVDPGMNLPWADDLDRAGFPVHQMLGQWGHEFPDQRPDQPGDHRMRWDWAEVLLHWYDYWLKEETTVELGPAVQVADTLGRWRAEDAWPPHDATPVTLELSADGTLAQSGEASAGEIRLQPNPLGEEDDARSTVPLQGYADFRLGPIDEELLIAGLPKVHVTVIPEGPGGTLAAWLYERTPQGMERIGWASINLLYADGTYDPTPVVPGQPIVAKMEIQPMDGVVREGNELVLRIWGYPPTDRVTNGAGATITLVLGDEASTVELPVIERGPEAYFTPPAPAEE